MQLQTHPHPALVCLLALSVIACQQPEPTPAASVVATPMTTPAAPDPAPDPDPAPTPTTTAPAPDPAPAHAFDLDDDIIDFDEYRHVLDHAVTLAAARNVPLATPDSLSMAELIGILPDLLRKNVTFKHGLHFGGLRGMEGDRIVSQSADPLYPRVILWDEENGFSLSWNGGIAGQTAANRLDILGFDRKTNAFFTFAQDFPLTTRKGPGFVGDYHTGRGSDAECTTCHGPANRPIFPMYPDWPAFYGSDNDEISPVDVTREIANLKRAPESAATAKRISELEIRRTYLTREHAFYALFRRSLETPPEGDDGPWFAEIIQDLSKRMRSLRILEKGRITEEINRMAAITPAEHAAAAERYRPLIAVLDGPSYKAFETLPELRDDARRHFPYRPSNEESIEHQSRAFFFRPNLRLGILYNRLNARHIHHRFLKHHFAADPLLRDVFVATAMDCVWEPITLPGGRNPDQTALLRDIVKHYGLKTIRAKAGRERIDFIDLFGSFKAVDAPGTALTLADYDIRFSYYNPHYERAARDGYKTRSIMGLGYYIVGSENVPGRYSAVKYNEAVYSNGELYFNSYWDGTGTMNEYLVAMAVAENEEYQPLRAHLRNFLLKNGRYPAHFLIDRKYCHAMDRILSDAMDHVVGWYPLPYPNDLGAVHHREAYTLRQIPGDVIPDYYSGTPDAVVNVRRNLPEAHTEGCRVVFERMAAHRDAVSGR